MTSWNNLTVIPTYAEKSRYTALTHWLADAKPISAYGSLRKFLEATDEPLFPTLCGREAVTALDQPGVPDCQACITAWRQATGITLSLATIAKPGGALLSMLPAVGV